MPAPSSSLPPHGAGRLHLGHLALAFGPKIALPKKIAQFVFLIELSWVKSPQGFSVNSCCLPRALMMSGRLRMSVSWVPAILDASQWNLGGGLRLMLAQSCIVGQLNV